MEGRVVISEKSEGNVNVIVNMYGWECMWVFTGQCAYPCQPDGAVPGATAVMAVQYCMGVCGEGGRVFFNGGCSNASTV